MERSVRWGLARCVALLIASAAPMTPTVPDTVCSFLTPQQVTSVSGRRGL
ncbi:MAG TPA: hypothetical protein VEL79_08010 [Vicinamibacterales bacterium]|nr:hypothetical protein [Vicinamibacterales bacterium]